MKYKIGDEVLVRCKIINVDHEASMPYEVCRTECVSGFSKPLYILAGDEDIVDMSADEAWEIAKRICTSDYDGCENALLNSDLDEIFGTVDCGKIMNRYTPQQARDKIEAWESVNGIKVGDEVVLKSDPDNDEYRFFVTYINSKTKKMGGFSFHRESVFCERNAERYQKTGRHIDIEGLLRNIGGTDA